MKKALRGFTMVELMVVVSVMAILSTIIYANFNDGRAQARDAERKADLRNLQTAIELYKQEHGRYPAGCNGPDNWSGQKGTDYECGNNSGQYIEDLAPEYISSLPVDPKLNGDDSGYVYLTNTNGTVYKLVARNTVESENVTYNHEFAACDVKSNDSNQFFVPQSSPGVCPASTLPFVISVPEGSWCSYGVCNIFYIGPGYDRPAPECDAGDIINSYGVWGGYANPSDVGGAVSDEIKTERGTEKIICDMP